MNFATSPGEGSIETLHDAVKSVINQVDIVRIYWNRYSIYQLPDWAHHRKISNMVGGADLTDNGKFRFVEDCYYGELYLTGDDDIIYPPNYAAMTREWLMRYPVVCYHGRILNDTELAGESYYKGGHYVYSFVNTFLDGRMVDVPGTGVMGFRTDKFRPVKLWRREPKKMADLIMGLQCAEDRVKIWCAPHAQGWIRPNDYRHRQSIAIEAQNLDQSKHCEIVKRILLLK